MVGLSFWCCFFFWLAFSVIAISEISKATSSPSFSTSQKKITYIYINISLACRTLGLRCYFLHTSLPQVCTLTSIFFWLMFFWLEQWPSLKRRDSSESTEILPPMSASGLVWSYLSWEQSVLHQHPEIAEKKNQSEWRGSTTYHISQKNIYLSTDSWKALKKD